MLVMFFYVLVWADFLFCYPKTGISPLLISPLKAPFDAKDLRQQDSHEFLVNVLTRVVEEFLAKYDHLK